MASPRAPRKGKKNVGKPKGPRTLWIRVRVSAVEMDELKVLGDRGDFATNVRQILLDRARNERTKILNAAELRRFQLYLVIDRQAQLVREQYRVPAKDPLGALLRAVDQLGKVKEDAGDDGSTLD